VSHSPGFPCRPAPVPGSAARWPGLPAREVVIGGVAVTCGQAAADAAALEAAGGVMIRQVLAAACSPLAACDYLSALEPFKAPAVKEAPPASRDGYGRGAAGRPAARTAFIAAIASALEEARRQEPAVVFAAELDAAQAAFAADEGYAAAIAAAAVAVLAREHAARLRGTLSAAVRQAAAACDGPRGPGGHRGEFACAAVSACGTGDCRLAAAGLAGAAMTVPAPSGRVTRPGNHAAAGQGFSVSAALAALERRVPFDAAAAARTVRVAAGDCAAARDAVRV